MNLLERFAAALGYDLVPRKKAKALERQWIHAIEARGVDGVLDVGANVGQYGKRLRKWGYRGPILSFEPLPAPHAALSRAAAGDPLWEIAPPMAIGDHDGVVEIDRSAESDMSSILAQSSDLEAFSPSSEVVERLETPIRRLDGLDRVREQPWRAIFLKADVQGFEKQVVDGAQGLLERVAGFQLELSFEPLYQGEEPWLAMIERLERLGYRPKVALPGYYERKRARQLQIDLLFFKDG